MLGAIGFFTLTTLKSSIDDVSRYSEAVFPVGGFHACILVSLIRHIEARRYVVHAWLWTLRSHVEP